MSAGRSFLRGVSSGWLLLVVTVIVQLVQVGMARQYLGDEEFALFNVLSNLVATFLIAEVGVRSAFLRLLLDAQASGNERYQRLWSSAVCVFVAQAALIVLLGALCLPFLAGWFHLPPALIGVARLVFGCLCLITALQHAFGYHMIAIVAAHRFVLMNGLTAIGVVGGLLVFWSSLQVGAGLWSYVWAAIPSCFCFCVGGPITTRVLGISKRFTPSLVTKAEIVQIFKLGLDLFFVALYNLFLAHTLMLYASNFLVLVEIGVLAVNLKLVQMALQGCQRITGTAEPILAKMVSENDLGRFRRAWTLSAKGAVICTLSVIGILYLWAGFLVTWWTSPADVLHGAELALLLLLPLRYTLHSTFVLSVANFKAANRLRWAFLWELVVYSLMSFVVGRTAGLVGLLGANIAALFLGSMVPGMRLLARLGEFPRGMLCFLLLRSTLPALAVYVLLAWLCPAPEHLPLAIRSALSFGWLGWVGLCSWFICFTTEERIEMRGRFRLPHIFSSGRSA